MTGLIYVAIIAVWAVVLVPAWLRRHDHLDPERSVDRFSRSMQTLAAPPSVLGIPMPVDQPTAHVDDTPVEVVRVGRADLAAAGTRASQAFSRAGARAGGVSAATRRRIVLGVLAGVLVVVGALVALGTLAPVALVAPVLLLGGFVGLARHQVRTSRQARARSADRVVISRASASAPVARPAAGQSGATWEARPTTLPTYVTAPLASGFPRVIDTETPGAWTAAAMLERAQQEKVRAERMAAAKAEAIARAKAEQAAAEARSRDEEFLSEQTAQWMAEGNTAPIYRRRAVNE